MSSPRDKAEAWRDNLNPCRRWGYRSTCYNASTSVKGKSVGYRRQPGEEDILDVDSIPEDYIFYSRDTSFVQGVLETTKNKGVDVVLKSLAGNQLRATWKCTAPFSRSVEIGQQDIKTNTYLKMAPFERTVTFAGADLGDLIQLRPETLQKVFAGIIDLIAAGSVKPVSPVDEFAVSEIQ